METIYRLNIQGFKIYEIPINFRNRKKGKSKIPKIEILRTLKNLFKLNLNFKNISYQASFLLIHLIN